MKELTHVTPLGMESAGNRTFAVDTTFVLFFLAVEFGRFADGFGIDTILFGASLLMLVVFPYFLPADDKVDFGTWVVGRTFIAGFGAVIGALFNLSLGTLIPDSLGFVPMSLLIVTALISCYLQIYGLLRLRTAR